MHFLVPSRGTADPPLLLESLLERIADFFGNLLGPPFNRTAAASLPVHLHVGQPLASIPTRRRRDVEQNRHRMIGSKTL